MKTASGSPLTGKAIKRMQLAEQAMAALSAIRLVGIVAALALAIAATACTDNASSPPDAGALPSCTSLGCANAGDGECTLAGHCVCMMQACQREGGLGFPHDAGTDQ